MNKILRIDEEPTREALELSELSPEERLRYVRWWRKDHSLNVLIWVTGALLVLFWAADKYIQNQWKTLFYVVAGGVFAIGAVWQSLLKCPRCGVEFRGGLPSLLPGSIRSTSRCFACDLSREEVKVLATQMKSEVKDDAGGRII